VSVKNITERNNFKKVKEIFGVARLTDVLLTHAALELIENEMRSI
jgi:hypothetical protein